MPQDQILQGHRKRVSYFRKITPFAVDLADDVQGLEVGHFAYPIWNLPYLEKVWKAREISV